MISPECRKCGDPANEHFVRGKIRGCVSLGLGSGQTASECDCDGYEPMIDDDALRVLAEAEGEARAREEDQARYEYEAARASEDEYRYTHGG